MFNPAQLWFQQRINLTKNSGARTGRGLPKVNFAYPEPCTLSIQDIMLDTYEEGGGKSVLSYLQQFEKAVNFAESGEDKEKRPPVTSLPGAVSNTSAVLLFSLVTHC